MRKLKFICPNKFWIDTRKVFFGEEAIHNWTSPSVGGSGQLQEKAWSPTADVLHVDICHNLFFYDGQNN